MHGHQKIIGINDVRQTIGPNRDLEEVEQVARATATEDAEVTNGPDVVHVITGLDCSKDWLAIGCVQRLRELDGPLISRARIWILCATRLVKDNVQAAGVTGCDPRHHGMTEAGADLEWAVEVFALVVRNREPDVEVIDARIIHCPGHVDIACLIHRCGREIVGGVVAKSSSSRRRRWGSRW